MLNPPSQPALGNLQLALDRMNGHLFMQRNVFVRHAAKEAHFDKARFPRFVLGERLQRVVKGNHNPLPFGSEIERFPQHNLARRTPLLGLPRSSVIDQNLPHDTSRNGKEMSAILKISSFVSDKAKVRFVNQRRRL